MDRVDTEALREWAEASTAGFVRTTVRGLADKFDEYHEHMDNAPAPVVAPRKITVHALLNSEVVLGE